MIPLFSGARIYYVATGGNDNQPGTLNAPFRSLNKAWTQVAAGDTIYIRGGTYPLPTQVYLKGKNGTPGNLIKVWNYPGETPKFTKGPGYTHPNYFRGGCYFSGNYVHFRGLEIYGFTQEDPYVWSGWLVDGGSHNIFELFNVHDNGAGFNIQGNSTGNLVLNCDSHHNYDPQTYGGNADGIGLSFISEGTSNIVKGCRAWSNSDDGFDVFENNGHVLFEQCWSWNNGYIPYTGNTGGNGEGFKFGSTQPNGNTILRTVKNCLAFSNRLSGFHQQEADCRVEVYNSFAFNNGQNGFYFDYLNRAHIFKNNISFNNNDNQASLGPASVSSHNSYGGGGDGGGNGWSNTTSVTDFLSLVVIGIDGARDLLGGLPLLSFAHLSVISDLVDAGTDVGIPFNGQAPDIGAFETGGAAPNQSPVADAGTDKSITLPVNSITQSGSGSDPDGMIVSFQWTRISGPGQYVIISPASPQTVINNLVAGTYLFELRVTDNLGAVDRDTMQLVVNIQPPSPPPNQSPSAQAGPDRVITLPVNSITLYGSGSDPDGYVTAYQWSKISGPASYTIVSPSQPTTLIHTLVQGVYRFELKVTDNDGASGKDTISVTVFMASSPPPSPNRPPLAHAGPDLEITLPVNHTVLTGSGTDPDGSVTGFQWIKISGPGTYTITSPTSPSTALYNLAAGIYQFELTVSDNQGARGKDTVRVLVKKEPGVTPAAMLYPIPAVSMVTIRINLPLTSEKTFLQLLDVKGSVVYLKEFSLNQPVHTEQLDVHSLPAGTYFIILITGPNRMTLPFIKQ